MPYGNLLADVVQGSVANTPPAFRDGNGTQVGTLCRAWVNFNGTGTVAIRASFNVSSITDNGVGDYTVNFTNAMPNLNYVANMSGARKAGNTGFMIFEASDALGRTASTIRMLNTNQSAQAEDNANLYLSIFR